MPSYMISLRGQPTSDGAGPTKPKPRYLRYDTPDTPPATLSDLRWRNDIIAQFPKPPAAARTGVGPGRSGDIIFFVHGFNVSAEAALAAHFDNAQKLADAGFKGVFVSFDWPSDGLVFAYLDDRENARLAANGLLGSGISLLREAQVAGCTINLHVIAHSMGCFVVQQAFTQSYQDVPPDWRIGQLVMVAADVDHTVFSAGNPSAKAFGQHAGRLTAYINRSDKALAASNAKRLEMAPRMGRVGLPDDAPDFMCQVDCSNLFDAVYPEVLQHLDPVATHCFYFGQPVFWQDVVLTLAGGLDRNVIPTRLGGLPPPPGVDRLTLKNAPLAAPDYATALNKASPSGDFRLP